jgi:hypothetical protein
MELLCAIQREAETNTMLQNHTNVEVHPFGYRAWLEAVRMTAVVRQDVSLHLDVVERYCPTEGAQTRLSDQPGRVFVLEQELSDDLFGSSASAIEAWLEGSTPVPLDRRVTRYQPIRLGGLDVPDRALAVLRGGESGSSIELERKPARRRRRKRGRRPADPNARRLDKQIYEARKDKTLPFRQIARDFDIDVSDARRAFDRHRKRISRGAV